MVHLSRRFSWVRTSTSGKLAVLAKPYSYPSLVNCGISEFTLPGTARGGTTFPWGCPNAQFSTASEVEVMDSTGWQQNKPRQSIPSCFLSKGWSFSQLREAAHHPTVTVRRSRFGKCEQVNKLPRRQNHLLSHRRC